MLFVEMDGVVRQTAEDLGRPLRGPLDIEVFPDTVERLRLWRAAGGRVVGFGQQGGIALGEVGEDIVVRTEWAVREKAANQLDLVVHCPHHPDATLPDQARCWCRLPKPGMLIAAQQEVALRQHERYPLWMALLVARSPEALQCAADLGMDHLEGDRWRRDGGR
jgi:D-glycero-D-manno-heptose 1,7-bisphosphate phosphatase